MCSVVEMLGTGLGHPHTFTRALTLLPDAGDFLSLGARTPAALPLRRVLAGARQTAF